MTMTLPNPDEDGPDTSPIYVNDYDVASNLVAATDPLGNVTQFVYDDRNRLVEQIDHDPDGDAGPLESPRTQFTYDGVNNVLTSSDPLDRVTQFEYDDIYRLTITTLPDPDGAGPEATPVYQIGYDPQSNVISEIDPLGNETTFEYDERYVITKITAPDPDGAAGPSGNPITQFTYDAAEQLIQLSDPLDRVTTFEYDLLGRTTRTILPDPDQDGPDTTPIVTNVFDPYGNVVSMIDPLGNETKYEYDALHRLVRQTDPDPDGADLPLQSPVTTFEYDAAHQVLSVSDPLQRVTTFDYDDLGRVITTTQPDPDGDGPDDSPVTTFVYDLVDNELSMADPLGNVTEYEYDNLYRLVTTTQADPDGAAGPDTNPVWRTTYDIASQVLTTVDPLDRTTSYAYDDLGRVIEITEPDPDRGGPLAAPVMTYLYDLVGNAIVDDRFARECHAVRIRQSVSPRATNRYRSGRRRAA